MARIAFITREFITEYADGGGLGNYLNRMTKALRDHGHEPEVFVTSCHPPGLLDHEGVLVHRVAPAEHDLAIRAAYRLARGVGRQDLHPMISWLGAALGLARCLREREREAPFDAVQSADYLAPGLFVDRSRRRPHLVRCSSAWDLYEAIDRPGSSPGWQARLEGAALRRADAVYAPSRFVADHYRKTRRIDVEVVRPPVFVEATPGADVPADLPGRYLLHFGQLMERKGTGWLAEALPLAWREEPELTVVFAGRARPEDRAAWSGGWGPGRDRVRWLGPLAKPELYAVLRRAEATVLPSLVDNLPNTVLESLMLGVPVIGTDGASIDELVEPGVTGDLVRPHDVPALAAALVRAWRGRMTARRGFAWHSAISDQMGPEAAVAGLIELIARARRRGPVRRAARSQSQPQPGRRP